MEKQRKRRLERKLKEREEEWERINRPIERFINRMKKEVKYNVTNWLDWYFGDDRERNITQKYLRRFGIICVDVILLRLLGFI